jgi:hypothetical protein
MITIEMGRTKCSGALMSISNILWFKERYYVVIVSVANGLLRGEEHELVSIAMVWHVQYVVIL